MRHFAIATGVGAVFGGLLAVFFWLVDLTPAQASAESVELDALLRTYLTIMGFIFGLVTTFVVYSVIVFRRRQAEERGAPFRRHTVLERGWLVVTTALVLGSALDAVVVWESVVGHGRGSVHAANELEIMVTARQWSWQFEYPQYGITSKEIVLEQNRPVVFRITSTDVVHSLFVPEFRMKIDAVPGMETHMRVVPTTLGVYQIGCAELCGLGHTIMGAEVKVLESGGFLAWASGAGGQQVAQQ